MNKDENTISIGAAKSKIKRESTSRRVELQIESITENSIGLSREPGLQGELSPRNEFIQPIVANQHLRPSRQLAVVSRQRLLDSVSSRRSESTWTFATPTGHRGSLSLWNASSCKSCTIPRDETTDVPEKRGQKGRKTTNEDVSWKNVLASRVDRRTKQVGAEVEERRKTGSRGCRRRDKKPKVAERKREG